MIIPGKIKVWLRTFDVKEVNKEGFSQKAKRGYNLRGEVDWDNKTINILKGLSQEEKEETLLHEIGHIVDDLAGSKLSEAQVTSTMQILYFILKENKLLSEG